MAFIPSWERLSDALARVMKANRSSQNEAQAEICFAIAERAVRIHAKLGSKIGGGTSYDTVLDGKCFNVPTGLKPEDLDWRESRPLKAWRVPRGAFRSHGHWNLEWIELWRADVTNVLCTPSEPDSPNQRCQSETGAKSRSRPAHERAQRAIAAVYPDGVPTQFLKPNSLLCRRIGEWLKHNDLPSVSNDTILRAAGRRK